MSVTILDDLSPRDPGTGMSRGKGSGFAARLTDKPGLSHRRRPGCGQLPGLGQLLAFLIASSAAFGAWADDAPGAASAAADGGQAMGDDRFALYWQATYVQQYAFNFHSPYVGPNSLTPDQTRQTSDMTLFAGVRLWPGAEFWVNPEMDQGFGLDNTLGVAGFPSAEAYKVGYDLPYFRLPRAFMRYTINLGEEKTDQVEAGPNQFSGSHSADRLVVTLGKFSVVDIFDTNQYAHDPRGDFLNWSVVDAGSFDYAADAWGFTVGGAAEWYVSSWTLRGGIFSLSDVPNSTRLAGQFDQFQMVTELERRYAVLGQSGRVMLTAFDSRGRMGLLNAAVDLAQETGTPVDIAAVRSYRSRLGASLDVEQPISDRLGVFLRAGKAQGNVETFEFTDIDRTLAMGMSLKGSDWGRPRDAIGLAGVLNGISGDRERYLNAGGLGVLVGDGQLPHPGLEKILETYYSAGITSWAQATLDFQHVTNPGYNTDRGPVPIVAVRVHAQF
jgi:high affinity Mn2+ porin